MATATISTTPTTDPATIARLAAEIKRRPINKFQLARDLGMSNPWYIYKVLKGERPARAKFVEDVCTWTGIPLKAVLPEDEYLALHEYLEQDAAEENLQRMGMGY